MLERLYARLHAQVAQVVQVVQAVQVALLSTSLALRCYLVRYLSGASPISRGMGTGTGTSTSTGAGDDAGTGVMMSLTRRRG